MILFRAHFNLSALMARVIIFWRGIDIHVVMFCEVLAEESRRVKSPNLFHSMNYWKFLHMEQYVNHSYLYNNCIYTIFKLQKKIRTLENQLQQKYLPSNSFHVLGFWWKLINKDKIFVKRLYNWRNRNSKYTWKRSSFQSKTKNLLK